MNSSNVSSSWPLTVCVFIFSDTKSNMMATTLKFCFCTVFSPYSALASAFLNFSESVLICFLYSSSRCWAFSSATSRAFKFSPIILNSSSKSTILFSPDSALSSPLAITHTIANYPGVDPTISGQKLLDDMREQAVQYGTDYRRAQVFMLDFEDKEDNLYNKVVYTPDVTYRARALVLATGAMGRKPSFKG